MTDVNAAGTTESITSSQDHNDLYDPYMTSEDRSMSSQFALVLSTTLEWLEWFGWKTIVLFLINFLCMAVSIALIAVINESTRKAKKRMLRSSVKMTPINLNPIISTSSTIDSSQLLTTTINKHYSALYKPKAIRPCGFYHPPGSNFKSTPIPGIKSSFHSIQQPNFVDLERVPTPSKQKQAFILESQTLTKQTQEFFNQSQQNKVNNNNNVVQPENNNKHNPNHETVRIDSEIKTLTIPKKTRNDEVRSPTKDKHDQIRMPRPSSDFGIAQQTLENMANRPTGSLPRMHLYGTNMNKNNPLPLSHSPNL